MSIHNTSFMNIIIEINIIVSQFKFSKSAMESYRSVKMIILIQILNQTNYIINFNINNFFTM